MTTRNDRRLGVVNGQAGVITAIDGRRCEVRFDDGRGVLLPERYVRDGHLDHGYASTAHRAQGGTVDRTFVLGSDELYREWGYTALSRHRQNARFYVTAARTFVNATPPPLQPGEDVGVQVARLLKASQAKQLAGEGIYGSAATELGAVGRRLDALEARMKTLRAERQGPAGTNAGVARARTRSSTGANRSAGSCGGRPLASLSVRSEPRRHRTSSARKIPSRRPNPPVSARSGATSAESSDHGCPGRACIRPCSRRCAAHPPHRLAHATRRPHRARRGRATEDSGLDGV